MCEWADVYHAACGHWSPTATLQHSCPRSRTVDGRPVGCISPRTVGMLRREDRCAVCAADKEGLARALASVRIAIGVRGKRDESPPKRSGERRRRDSHQDEDGDTDNDGDDVSMNSLRTSSATRSCSHSQPLSSEASSPTPSRLPANMLHFPQPSSCEMYPHTFLRDRTRNLLGPTHPHPFIPASACPQLQHQRARRTHRLSYPFTRDEVQEAAARKRSLVVVKLWWERKAEGHWKGGPRRLSLG